LQNNSEQIKRLQPGDSQTVDFRLTSLKPGAQQGLLKIVGQDSLAADDVRYFTIEVRPPWPVLVVAQQPTAETALFLTQAIAPTENRKRHDARFECTVIDYHEIPSDQKTLNNYAAICLLDPPGLDAGTWQSLTDYAAAGHGVGVFLG